MPKFRKKPIVIEAFQMTEKTRLDNRDWPAWLNEAWNKKRHESGALFIIDPEQEGASQLAITTLEGAHEISWGDWIIQGIKGELYPCKPDIFDATYEPARGGALAGLVLGAVLGNWWGRRSRA